jgi:hypothetical protein
MNSEITFQTLRQYLLDLGLTEKNGNGALLFEHPRQGLLFLFRLYRPQEKVHIKDLITVRKMLDERGLVARDDFERWTWQQAAASLP